MCEIILTFFFFLPKTSGATNSPVFLKGGEKKLPLFSTEGLYPLISRSGVDTSAVHGTSNCPEASVLNLEDSLAPYVNS